MSGPVCSFPCKELQMIVPYSLDLWITLLSLICIYIYPQLAIFSQVMCFLFTLLLLFLSTPRTATAFPFTQSDDDDPGSLVAQPLYFNNNNMLQISGNNQPVNGNPIVCKSDSGESLKFLIGKRGVEKCPPSLETIPEKNPAPALPILNDEPLRFTSPDSLLPLKMDSVADDDKCPTRLMKMSKIPVCDSGKRGRDLMRLPGETTYTIFNIRPCMSLLIVFLLSFDHLWAYMLRILLMALFCLYRF